MERHDSSMPVRAIIYIALTAAVGSVALGMAFLHWHCDDPLKFECYLAIAVLASTMKVRLPGVESTMSVNFLLVLLGILELSLPETLLIGCCATLVQSIWKTQHKPEPVKVLFNVVSMTAPAICLAYFAYYFSAGLLHNSKPLMLMVASFTYFLANTIAVALVIALSTRSSLRGVWSVTHFWSLPYYLVGAAIVDMISFSNRYVGWENGLLIVPIVYMIYRSYYLYLGRLEDAKKRIEIEAAHVEEVCELHLRTIEALALAIEAKDQITSRHLHRVRTFAVEIGTDLGLDGKDLDALRAAALLHDIGKLAVPDHIINKPGRLTPEEFEKLKIHPIVGAAILDKVAFPYPVAPIVRSHHEKWDGSGYPDGLKGEEIPIGARILTAVDCLDALASDRQYRPALPLDEAMNQIEREAGTSFDSRVVEVLRRRYLELERKARNTSEVEKRNSYIFNQIVERGKRPDAGFEHTVDRRRGSNVDFLSSIASARQEAHTLFELSQDLGNSLSLDETLSLVAIRLRKLVPYDSIVAFVRKGDLLTPEFVSGDDYRLLSSLTIPIGQGLCGWVAEHLKPIVNGNPLIEVGVGEDLNTATRLRSTLAVPLEGVNGLVGVLALYRAEEDAFTSDHLRVLQVITSRVAYFIENALKYREAENSATIDFLTGMANARALSIHLDQELARCKREGANLAIMVCDLNGFKQINDCHGHLVGDNVLKVVANLMRETCRTYDYVARMGGDEFVIIAPNMSPGAAEERVQLLNTFAQHAGREVCGYDGLSLSVGVAFCPQDALDAERLLVEADRRMYAAKQQFYQNADRVPPRSAQQPQLYSVVATGM
jgi:diguanylate cyclase (GGDEF)-like protein/putative nucleotidyltransferase with HDIG domain